MGFLINVSERQDFSGQLNAALSIDSLWHGKGEESLLEVADKHLRIVVTGQKGCAYSLWKKQDAKDVADSFVYILGWCYRIDRNNDALTHDDYEEMLDRCRKRMPPIGEDFGGNYVVVIYDRTLGRIVIQPDRWAMSSVYFSSTDTCSVVSDRAIPAATLTGASLDGHSLFSLIRGTHIPFGRSLFSGVQRILCGCYLDIDVAARRIRMKRAFPVYVPVRERTFNEATEGVIETMCKIGRRLVTYESAMFDLTGGNDTRLTAAAVSRQLLNSSHGNFVWRVAGGCDDPDVRIAQSIAAIYGWKLLRLENLSVGDATVEDLTKAVLHSDGTCLIDSAFARIRQEETVEGKWEWLVGSIGGELARGFFWRHEMASLGRSPKVNYKSLLAYRLYASRVLNSEAFGLGAPSANEHDEVLLQPYRQIGEAGGDLLNPYKLDAMYLHKLCYSAGNMQSWLNGLRNVCYPLLSWEISRLILSTPWKLRVSRRLMLHAIEQLAPKFARVSNDNGEPMRPLRLTTLPFYLKPGLLTGVRVVPRIIRRYLYAPAGTTQADEAAPPTSWIEIAKNARCVGSLVDSSYVTRTSCEAAGSSRSNDSLRAFYTLLTLELLLREIPQIQKRIVFDSGPDIVQ